MKQKQFNKPNAFRFKRFANKAYSMFNSMHKLVNIGVVTACVLTFAQPASTSAQTTLASDQSKEEATTEKELDEVTVTASRVQMSLNQAARLVTIITKEEIAQAPVQSIQDLLNYSANIDVLQRGGHGVQADISIRGGSFDQTAILLNGINLSSPHTGHYSFDIPVNLSDIERIEIIHGPSSITYGASAFSGGINIITKKKPDNKAHFSIEAGADNLYGVEARGAVENKTVINQLSVGYKTSDGYTRNSDYDIFNMLLQTRLNIDKSKVDIQLGYNDKKYGANTFYTPEYSNQYDNTETYLASVSAETGDKLKFLPKIYWTRHHDRFELYRDGTPNIPDWYKGHNYHRSDVYGANLNLQYASKLGITSFGSEFRNEGVLSNVLGKPMDTADGKYTKSDDRTNISFALEHNILLNNFTLSLGVLANYNTAIKGDYKFYPAINASYRIISDLKVYASWNKATRMPTFTDLYYNTATHSGNANLKPENSESTEIGFKYANSIMQTSICGYYMEGDNLIDWIKENPDEKWQSVNLANVYKTGLELDLKLFIHELIRFTAPATTLQIGYARLHQSGSNNSGEVSSNYILNYLRDKLTAQLNLPLYKGISVNTTFRWQKRMGNYIKYENEKLVGKTSYSPFSIMDIRVNWKIENFNLNLSANNLYNTHYYDLGNIPQAGFWMSGGVSYTIN